jgi:hypothetical protein
MSRTIKRDRRDRPRARKLSRKSAKLRSATMRAPLFEHPPPDDERRLPPMQLWKARHDDDHD